MQIEGLSGETEQIHQYGELCRKIAEARSRGEDFLLRGAKQIALFRWKNSKKAKRVYSSKEPYPYAKHGNTYTLSVETAERWERYLEYCKLRRIDPLRHLEKYGFGPSPNEAAPATAQRRDAAAG